jgi:hypothetical protein
MPLTPVQICNIALGRIGSQKIADLTERSAEGMACNDLYELKRDEALEAAIWPFATVRSALTLQGTAPDEWGYSYAYPAQCMRAQRIDDGLRVRRREQEIPYAIEMDSQGRKLIYTDQPDAVLVYTKKLTDTTLFQPSFIDALAWLIGAELALVLPVDDKKEVLCRNRYMMRLEEAYGLALNELGEDNPPVNEFLAARGGTASTDGTIIT